jgi:periplasmic mercuric ion binding protein
MIRRVFSLGLMFAVGFGLCSWAARSLGTTYGADAELEVTLSKTHVCCKRCEQSVAQILEKAGVKGSASKADGSIKFTASNEEKAQKVLDQLAVGGFHGQTDHKKLAIKDDSGVTSGNVTSLDLKGLHNCCGSCNTAIKGAIKTVKGVESDTAKANSETVTIKGDFDALAVIKALNEAGFHASVAK